MTTIQARNLDDALDTIELALIDYRRKNTFWRKGAINKKIYSGDWDRCYYHAPASSAAKNLIKRIKRENNSIYRNTPANKFFNSEFENNGAGSVSISKTNLMLHEHWLSVRVINLSLLETFTTVGSTYLKKKYEQQRAPYRGETFEVQYGMCNSGHEEVIEVRNSINHELARF